MKQRSDRFLIWAIAVSFGVHLIVAVAMRFAPAQAKAEQPATHAYIVIRTPAPTPTPPPQLPVPHRAQPRTAAAAPHVKTPVQHSRIAQPGPVEGTPGPASSAPPETGSGQGDTPGPSVEPTATPKPSCANPNVAASVADVVDANPPEGTEGESGTAQVRVTLSAAGAVLGTDIFRSAGDIRLDREALRAARASTYRAEIRDCLSIGGSYLFTVEFTQP